MPSDAFIKQLECGPNYALILTEEDDLYVWSETESILNPLMTDDPCEKVTAIKAHHQLSISFIETCTTFSDSSKTRVHILENLSFGLQPTRYSNLIEALIDFGNLASYTHIMIAKRGRDIEAAPKSGLEPELHTGPRPQKGKGRENFVYWFNLAAIVIVLCLISYHMISIGF